MSWLQNPMQLAGPVVIASILIVVLVCFRFSLVEMIRLFLHYNPLLSMLTKVVSVIVVFLLAVSDYFAVRNIFVMSQSAVGAESNIYAITFAAFLELFAFLAGVFLSKLMDTTNFRRADKRFNAVGFVTSSFGLLAAWFLAFTLRYSQLRMNLIDDNYINEKSGVFAVFFNLTSDQVFLLFSPILTSILAFGFSWFAFPSNSLSDQERLVRYRMKRYLHHRKRYQCLLHRYQHQRTLLWVNLGLDQNSFEDERLQSIEVYRDICLDRIRKNNVDSCTDVFTNEFSRYNKFAEAELLRYIQKLSTRSTLAHQIRAFTVQEILDAYHKSLGENVEADRWDGQELRERLKAKLHQDLDQASIVAYFRTNYRSS